MTNLPARSLGYTVVPAAQARERAGVLAFLSSQERTGGWELPRHLRVLAAFGSIELDLREARIPDGESVIEIVCLFGSVEILFPPAIHVDVDGDAMAGEFSFQRDYSVVPPAGAPRIRVTGSAYFASVECETRFPGEAKKDAVKRLKAGRR